MGIRKIGLAAMLSFSLVVSAESAIAEDKPSNRPDTDARARMGEVPMTDDSKQEIQSVLGSVINSAVEADFEDLVDNLTKADRDRIG